MGFDKDVKSMLMRELKKEQKELKAKLKKVEKEIKKLDNS